MRNICIILLLLAMLQGGGCSSRSSPYDTPAAYVALTLAVITSPVVQPIRYINKSIEESREQAEAHARALDILLPEDWRASCGPLLLEEQEQKAYRKAYASLLAEVEQRPPLLEDPRSATVYVLLGRCASAFENGEQPLLDARRLLSGSPSPERALAAAAVLRGKLFPAETSLFVWKEPPETFRAMPADVLFKPSLGGGRSWLIGQSVDWLANLRRAERLPPDPEAAALLLQAAETATPALADSPATSLSMGSVYDLASRVASCPANERTALRKKAFALYEKALAAPDRASACAALCMAVPLAPDDAVRLRLVRRFTSAFPGLKCKPTQADLSRLHGYKFVSYWEYYQAFLLDRPLQVAHPDPYFLSEISNRVLWEYWPVVLAGQLYPAFEKRESGRALCMMLFDAYVPQDAQRVFYFSDSRDIFYLPYALSETPDEQLPVLAHAETLKRVKNKDEASEFEDDIVALAAENALLHGDFAEFAQLKEKNGGSPILAPVCEELKQNADGIRRKMR